MKQWSKVYLYYDADCDGKGGGHPQWGAYPNKPDVTRLYDLDNNGKCLKGWDGFSLSNVFGGKNHDAGSYSAEASYE